MSTIQTAAAARAGAPSAHGGAPAHEPTPLQKRVEASFHRYVCMLRVPEAPQQNLAVQAANYLLSFTPFAAKPVPPTAVLHDQATILDAVCSRLELFDPRASEVFNSFLKPPSYEAVNALFKEPSANQCCDPDLWAHTIKKLIVDNEEVFLNPSEETQKHLLASFTPVLRAMMIEKGYTDFEKVATCKNFLQNHFARACGANVYAETLAHEIPAAPKANIMTALGFPYNEANGAIVYEEQVLEAISNALQRDCEPTPQIPPYLSRLFDMFIPEFAEQGLFRATVNNDPQALLTEEPTLWAREIKRCIAGNSDLFLTPDENLQDDFLEAIIPILRDMMSVDTNKETLNKLKQQNSEQFSPEHLQRFLSTLSTACGSGIREKMAELLKNSPENYEVMIKQDPTLSVEALEDRATIVTALGFTYDNTTGALIWDEDRLAHISELLQDGDAPQGNSGSSDESSAAE